ncbi:TnsD family Tn7-like transposition protein [Paenibacillus sp. FSL M7-1455]|uniref:TnsD family Tn7-like transposition protein n=1 Tax=Paenibacillus TaxID=44249 RepID=UPI000543918E|nr:TnsD family Tn7-like transposition protein [Paenibacillus cookii]KHF31839.1 hypothetical protein CM49_05965 [Paenibacillus sp. P1XP2]
MNERYAIPVPYPDELLYSVITRYHLRANNTTSKWSYKELFGTENIIPTIDLPSHIEAFSRRSMLHGMTADDWMKGHTCYPFYAPFLPKDRANRLKQLMKGPDGSGIHALVGITASIVDRNSDLRFCSQCYEEDINQYGEPYWHRIHQLPGVWVCPVHRDVLHRITYPVSDRYGLTVLPISKKMFGSIPLAANLSAKTIDQLSDIARDIQALMKTNDMPVLYESRNIFLQRLRKQGYVTAGGRIRQQKLEEQFVICYGKELLEMLGSLPYGKDYTWLNLATRSARRAIHPLRQMLLIRFLYGSFNGFLEQSEVDDAPFGRGPWPCLNKAAEHYRTSIITDLRITRCTDTGRPVGTFTCECGFAYSRRGPDQSENDKYRRGRIKSFGPVWMDKLQVHLRQGISFRSMAALLGVDTNTVMKYAKGTVTTRNLEPALLKRPRKSSKPVRSKGSKHTRVDWEKRDLELSWIVEEACRRILSDCKNKPVRITIAAIGKRVGKLSLLEKQKQKLPVTTKVLSDYLESTSQFQIRRVRWTAEQMAGEWPLKRWKLVKKAGLRPGYAQEVSDEIDRCIGQGAVMNRIASAEVTPLWLH